LNDTDYQKTSGNKITLNYYKYSYSDSETFSGTQLTFLIKKKNFEYIFWQWSKAPTQETELLELYTKYSDEIYNALKQLDSITWNENASISMYYPGELVDFETD